MRRKVLGVAAIPLAVGGVAAATVLLTSTPASATSSTVAVTDNCQVDAPLTGAPFTLSTTFDGSAASTALPGAIVTGSGSAEPWTVPSDIDGNTVTEVDNFAVSLVVSSNATVQNVTLSGGSNLGTGTPSITRNGNEVTLNVPGPLTPGSIITLPTINFTFKAGSSAGAITTQLAGSGYSDPGTTVTGLMDQTDGSTVTGTVSCFPTTTSTLTSTTIL